jgi:hypothetical protein
MVLWFTWSVSIATARYLLRAGVFFGAFGTCAYVTETWIKGDGVIEPPRALAATCLATGLVLTGLGLRRVMHRK